MKEKSGSGFLRAAHTPKAMRAAHLLESARVLVILCSDTYYGTDTPVAGQQTISAHGIPATVTTAVVVMVVCANMLVILLLCPSSV